MEYTAKRDSREVSHFHYLYYLSKVFGRILETDFEEICHENGITSKIYDVLTVLKQKQTCSVSEIAQLGLMHISSAMNNCKSLEKDGLVKLMKDQQDSRVTNVALTAAGEEFIDKITGQMKHADFSIGEILDSAEHDIGIKPSFVDLHHIVHHYCDKETMNYISGFK
ncbi:MarR family winged helix-turn-helix transcriptional regulator [Isobaculum melis]|uniref:MarR family protein n=1 Tax=Isobaculum melis TaxID=142588 RepID=A0A1H9SU27_9LACT|nr:MarR family winged helix-turn-helix transcriptional regulator [Isobaculum melis]SER88500.1 MarR family protein [Isobaculum melis]